MKSLEIFGKIGMKSNEGGEIMVERKDRTEQIAFTVTADEKNQIVDAARREDMSVSMYCRRNLLKANGDK